MSDAHLKSEFRKACAVALADGLDLEQVYEGQDPEFMYDMVSKEVLYCMTVYTRHWSSGRAVLRSRGAQALVQHMQKVWDRAKVGIKHAQ